MKKTDLLYYDEYELHKFVNNFNKGFDINLFMKTYNNLNDIYLKKESVDEQISKMNFRYDNFDCSLMDYISMKYEELLPYTIKTDGDYIKLSLKTKIERLLKENIEDIDILFFKKLNASFLNEYEKNYSILFSLSFTIKKYREYTSNKSYSSFPHLNLKYDSIIEFCKLLNNPKQEIIYLEFIKDIYNKIETGNIDKSKPFVGDLPNKKSFFLKIDKEIELKSAISNNNEMILPEIHRQVEIEGIKSLFYDDSKEIKFDTYNFEKFYINKQINSLSDVTKKIVYLNWLKVELEKEIGINNITYEESKIVLNIIEWGNLDNKIAVNKLISYNERYKPTDAEWSYWTYGRNEFYLKPYLKEIKSQIEFWENQQKILNKENNNNISLPKENNFKKKENKIQLFGNIKQLKTLLGLLQDYDYIENKLDKDSSSEFYIANFIDSSGNNFTNEKPNYIVWKEQQNELAYLIGDLTNMHKLIAEEKFWIKTSYIFRNRNINKYFTPNSLSSLYHKKPKDTVKLDKIIKNVIKI